MGKTKLPKGVVGVGEFCRWYMLRYGMTYADLSSKLGISRGNLSEITAGKYLFPQKYITKLKPLLTKEESELLLEAIQKDIRGWYYADEVYPEEGQ